MQSQCLPHDDPTKHVKSASNEPPPQQARGHFGGLSMLLAVCFAFSAESRRRRRAHAGARRPAAVRLCRRRGRLQPRGLGPHRDAGRARRHRPDAVEGRPDPQPAADLDAEGHRLSSRRMFTRPEADNVQVTQQFSQPAAGQLHAQDDRPAPTSTRMFTKLLGQSHDQAVGHHRGAVGHQEAQPRARARQHRLDGVERQDDQPEDRGAQPADHAEERRQARRATSRSRSCRSPPTSTSAPATSTPPGSTGPTGKPPTAPAATRATPPRAVASRTARSGRPKPHSTWNGCVNDRDQNNDVNNTATVAGAPATLFRAHQAANCPTSMMPLATTGPR